MPGGRSPLPAASTALLLPTANVGRLSTWGRSGLPGGAGLAKTGCMKASAHLTINGPEDILGYIPHTLGYWPSRSLVAMTMQGKRLGATLRVDLPEGPVTRRRREEFARTVADYLLADTDANGTLLMFFTNDGWTEAAGPHISRGLLADLESALGLAGMPVRDAWYVGDEYWRNVYCTDTGCCPLPGRSVAEIRDSRLNAEMVYLGSSVGEPPGAPSAGGGEPQENAEVMAAERRWADQLRARRTSRAQFERVLDTWELAMDAEARTELPPELAGFLRAALGVPSWRDAVLVMAAAGRPAALAGAEEFGIFSPRPGIEATAPSLEGRTGTAGPAPAAPAGSVSVVAGADGAATPDTDSASRGEPATAPIPGYGEVLLGLRPELPDWNRMKRLEDVMLLLVSCGPGEAQAAAWTAKGWIEWCRGRGSFAHASLDRALDATPGYRLAELLSEVVRRGTICGWAARREAAWQKFGTDAA